MFDLMGSGRIGPGLLIGPWAGIWDLAWQSPTTGFAVLACLPTLLLTGFFLVTRDANRYQTESLVASSSSRDRRPTDGGKAAGRGRIAA
jgi:hypothetical protein